MTLKTALTFTALLLCASPALADNWKMDREQSRLTFTGTESGRAFSGNIPGFWAEISYDPAKPQEASLDVSIPLGGLTTGNATYDGEVKKSDWLAVSRLSNARYVAQGFTPIAGKPNSFTTKGELTLRETTLAVPLTFTLVVSGDTATATGSASLDRTAFGVGQGEWASGDVVGKTIGVNFTVVATR